MRLVLISTLLVALTLAASNKSNSLPVYCDVRVTNQLTSNFNKTWRVMVGTTQTLYDALNTIQKNDPSFSFASERYANIGEFVISICHMTACPDGKQYWETLSSVDGGPIKPTENGVSKTYPQTGDVYIFNMTIYTGNKV